MQMKNNKICGMRMQTKGLNIHMLAAVIGKEITNFQLL